jgi:hypothetical protein
LFGEFCFRGDGAFSESLQFEVANCCFGEVGQDGFSGCAGVQGHVDSGGQPVLQWYWSGSDEGHHGRTA